MNTLFVRIFTVILSMLLSSSLMAKGNFLSKDQIEAFERGHSDLSIQATSAVDKVGFKRQVYCSINGPAEVQGYRVQCRNASYIDFSIADCCIPGDHWQLKAKNWDSAPNTAVTNSPGRAGAFSNAARTYNYGGTPQNPGNMDTYLQCSMLHGVDVFGAGSYINIVSDASSCTITRDAKRSRIDRAP